MFSGLYSLVVLYTGIGVGLAAYLAGERYLEHRDDDA